MADTSRGDSSPQTGGLSTSARFLRFFLSGGVGFLIEAVVLTSLVKSFGFNIYLARAISFSIAVTATWVLNRRFAFADVASRQRRDEYSRYFLVQISGAVINLGIFAGLISARPVLAETPVLPLAAGAAIALFFNFAASRGLVFRGDKSQGITNLVMNQTPDTGYTGIDNLEVMKEAVRYNRYLNELVLAGLSSTDRVADFGAGSGTFASPLQGRCREITCIEPDATLRTYLSQQGLSSIDSSKRLVDESIDYVYSLNVLEHIEDDASALAEIHRVLKPGGRLLLYVPAFNLLFSSMDRKVGHFRRYRRGPLVALARQAGFAVEQARYVDSLGFLAALVYRFVANDSGDIDRGSLAFYDRFVFPVSRFLDKFAWPLAGKNLLVTAKKA